MKVKFESKDLYKGKYDELIESEGYEVIDDIVEEGLDFLEDENIKENIEPELQKSWVDVRQAAQKLLNTTYNILYDEKKTDVAIRKHMRSVKSLQQEVLRITAEKEEMQRDKLRRLVLEEILTLQNAIASFAGYKFKIAYLSMKNGKVKKIWEDENGIEHWNASGIISKANIQASTTAKLLNEKEEEWKENFGKLNNTLNEISLREKISKKQIKEKYFFIFWELKSSKAKWAGYKVSNEGLIGEAYFNFYIHKDNKFNKDIEQNVGRYMIIGVGGVDNMSGFLGGDVSYGKYEYVVKANDASFMQYTELITQYATEIASITSEMDLNEFLLKLDYSLRQKAKKLAKPIYKKDITRELISIAKQQLKL